MKQYNLIEALYEISRMMSVDIESITAIQYEDGSRCKFLVTVLHVNWFINLDDFTVKNLS